ncbi:uncharacterized protein LOC142158670 isoform X1 [Mixophyes fleayi]|uniref:uncharacterized protein LOC142158670 isoform X1 n=1 Tax=Mixophyes fleayi TaxID=3061075 RepID=UPI003F4DADD3
MSDKGEHLKPEMELCNSKDKKKQKDETPTPSLQDFIEDPKRKYSLVGLHYVVEFKVSGSNKTLVVCNLCRVKGKALEMRFHLFGMNHIKAYMEKHYLFLLEGLKGVGYQKPHLTMMLREYAKDIELMEGTDGVHTEYISESEFKERQETWVHSKYEDGKSDNPKLNYPVYRRKMAIIYSRDFKISSRAEAAEVLNLTQQLSDRLEQYYLKCKGLAAMRSSVTNTIIAKYEAPNMLPPNVQENIYFVNTPKLGLESTVQKTPWDTEEPSTSSMYPYNTKYTDSNFTGHKSYAPDTAGYGHMHVEQTMEYSKYVSNSSLNDNSSNIEATSESEPPVAPDVTDAKGHSDIDEEKNTVVPDQSSSHTSSSHELASETPSKHTHGKTSKTLSPDILLLLKGKDASTVTNILKTLSPFYPALQDVNLEMLAQVLVNTGALD